jgi:predicted transcriptional regulator
VSGLSEKPRSKLRIYRDILKTVDNEGHAKPTKILYTANLSYERLNRYLNELVSRGLLHEVDEEGGRYYEITEDGRKLLREITKAINFVEGFGLDI